MRIDFDSAWKDTTEVYFAALLELLDTPALPKFSDHEPVSCLDQEMQEVARALGDDGDPEDAANKADGGAGEAGLESQPCRDERQDDQQDQRQDDRQVRRRARRRSRRLRVDKLVRVPLPQPAGLDTEAAGSAGSVARLAGRLVKKAATAARPAYWLAHIEVQTQRDSTLPRRLFDYHYHIERRHRCRVITIAILGDLSRNDSIGSVVLAAASSARASLFARYGPAIGPRLALASSCERIRYAITFLPTESFRLSPSWRPGSFSSDIPPLGMGLGYVAIKLIDLEEKIELPRFRGNPVAMVIRAHLAALRTRRDLEARLMQRLALCRRLYEEGFSQKDVVFIHGLIDRLMILPRPLMVRFRQELFTLEKDKNMPYVDTLTRMSRQEGSLAQARESVIEALEIRFGEISPDLRERINALDNLRTLKAQHRRAITVPSLDQF